MISRLGLLSSFQASESEDQPDTEAEAGNSGQTADQSSVLLLRHSHQLLRRSHPEAPASEAVRRQKPGQPKLMHENVLHMGVYIVVVAALCVCLIPTSGAAHQNQLEIARVSERSSCMAIALALRRLGRPRGAPKRSDT